MIKFNMCKVPHLGWTSSCSSTGWALPACGAALLEKTWGSCQEAKLSRAHREPWKQGAIPLGCRDRGRARKSREFLYPSTLHLLNHKYCVQSETPHYKEGIGKLKRV